MNFSNLKTLYGKLGQLCMLPHRPVLLVLAMTIRMRKFIGTIFLVLFLIVYALVAMALGASKVVGGPYIVQVIYFLVAGLAWIIPAGILIRWMARPDPS